MKNYYFKKKKSGCEGCNIIPNSPPTGKLPFLSPPSDSGGGIAVHLALEVDRFVLHDHLIDRPAYQHRAFYGGRGGCSTRPLLDLVDPRPVLTVHHQLCWVTVPLADHVFTNAHIHASVVLPGVRDHQFATTHLKSILKEADGFSFINNEIKFKKWSLNMGILHTKPH